VRIEIFTMNGGNGTISASQSLSVVLQQRGASTRVTDIMKNFSGLGDLLTEVYNFFISRDLRLASSYMKFAHSFPIDKVEVLNNLSRKRLAHHIERRSPDLLVLISPWISGMVRSALRSMRGKLPKVAVVVVDLGPGVVQSWLDPLVDLTVFPTGECADYLLKGCSAPTQTEVLGMPVGPQFYNGVPSRKEAKERMGFEERTVTILGGREGGMFNLKVLDALIRQGHGYDVVVQCGRNHHLMEKVKARGAKALGFIPSIRDLMVASDVLITKAGALTLAELITLRTRFVVNTYPSIMPQEWGNVFFIEKYGLAPICEEPADLPRHVKDQLEDKRRPKAVDIVGTERIADRLLRMVNE
jgi:processive 1,2-diacylglycerol beta-glucosyltransferase